MIQQVRLRSFRTKKEKEIVPSDDDVPWFQAAMFGLTVGKTLLGAGGKAQASRAGKESVMLQLEDINESLANLSGTSLAKKEVGVEDFNRNVKNMSMKTSDTMTDTYRQQESIVGSSGFSLDSQLEEKFKIQGERISDTFINDRDNLANNLDKFMADVDEWELTERAKLTSQKRQLQAKHKYHSKTDNFLKALF